MRGNVQLFCRKIVFNFKTNKKLSTVKFERRKTVNSLKLLAIESELLNNIDIIINEFTRRYSKIAKKTEYDVLILERFFFNSLSIKLYFY